MRYLGGKRRLAKQIRDIIIDEVGTGNGTYYEPFIGGGAVGAVMGSLFDHAHYSDIHPDLIAMWSALNEGWQPPTEVSRERYQELKRAETSPERGFVGFGGSFGGRFFEGYAKGGFQANGEPRNHQAESARAVLKDIVGMRAKVSTTFTCIGYEALQPEAGSIVYCDPPYEDTTSYSDTGAFDSVSFWLTVQGWHEAGAHVYVSSYQAPPGWAPIMRREHRSSVRRGDEERHVASEALFKYSGGKPMMVKLENVMV